MSQHCEDDRRVAAVIKSSVLFSALHRALATVWLAADHSVAVAAIMRRTGEWTGLDAISRRLISGIMLIVAVVTHVILTLATLTPPGWIWLVLPGIATAVGTLLVVTSAFSGVTRS